MDITFSYKITGMKKATSLDGLTDVVTRVSFIYSGEANQTVIQHPFTDIAIPTPEAETFIPIEDLSEADVISWLEACYPIGPCKERITQDLNDIFEPKEEVTTFPWDQA